MTAHRNRHMPQDLAMHPVAELFPEMPESEFKDLCADIDAHGQREAIWLDEKQRVIDGRHRVRAAKALGRSVEARIYHGNEESVRDFVISLNLKRRHLSESQRSMVASRLANLQHGGNRKQVQEANLPLEGLKEDRQVSPPISQADAAKQLNVSPRSVKSATKVHRDGAPELIKAVEEGRVSVHTAAKAAKTLTPEQQIEALSKTPGKVGKIVREEVAKHEAKEARTKQWNSFVDDMHEKLRPADFDPAKERNRVQITSKLYGALQAIVALPSPEDLLPMVPEWREKELENLDAALAWLTEFSKLYKEARDGRVEKSA
jgi:ParB-like chromosome segregation protein Spo0J